MGRDQVALPAPRSGLNYHWVFTGHSINGSPTYGPLPDTPGVDGSDVFGSATLATSTCSSAMGTWGRSSYSIDLDTYHRLGNMADGELVDAQGL